MPLSTHDAQITDDLRFRIGYFLSGLTDTERLEAVDQLRCELRAQDPAAHHHSDVALASELRMWYYQLGPFLRPPFSDGQEVTLAVGTVARLRLALAQVATALTTR